MPPGDVVAHMYNAIQYFPLEGRVLDRIVRKRDNIGSNQAMLSRTRMMQRRKPALPLCLESTMARGMPCCAPITARSIMMRSPCHYSDGSLRVGANSNEHIEQWQPFTNVTSKSDEGPILVAECRFLRSALR